MPFCQNNFEMIMAGAGGGGGTPCIGSAGKIPIVQPHGTTKDPPFSAWSDVRPHFSPVRQITPMFPYMVHNYARCLEPDSRTAVEF